MKNIFFVFAILGIVLFAPSTGVCDNLEDARRRASDAYDYSGRAANSNDAQAARYYSRQTMSATEDTRDLASSGRASEAAGYANRAYDYSTRASRAENARDAQYYSRFAEKNAAEAESSIDSKIATNRAAKSASEVRDQERIRSEAARKRAEAAIAEMKASEVNETVEDKENKTMESKIIESFGQ